MFKSTLREMPSVDGRVVFTSFRYTGSTRGTCKAFHLHKRTIAFAKRHFDCGTIVPVMKGTKEDRTRPNLNPVAKILLKLGHCGRMRVPDSILGEIRDNPGKLNSTMFDSDNGRCIRRQLEFTWITA